MRVKKSTPTARTSGSAKGSLINALGPRLPNARPTATPVAVAPTLLLKSQVSPSKRAMYALHSPLKPNVRTRPERVLCVVPTQFERRAWNADFDAALLLRRRDPRRRSAAAGQPARWRPDETRGVRAGHRDRRRADRANRWGGRAPHMRGRRLGRQR